MWSKLITIIPNLVQMVLSFFRGGAYSDDGMVSEADAISMKEQQHSIKDEILLIVILVPLVAAFLPIPHGWLLDGFKILNMMPYWYQAIIVGIYMAVFGLRFMLPVMSTKGRIMTAKALPDSSLTNLVDNPDRQ